MRLKITISIILVVAFLRATSTEIKTDVLVAGGGASGVTAALQAARSGAHVVVVEDTPWLGGMLTAAGVSCTDGNHRLPSGIWGEFRQKLYDHYGGSEAVFTGWVSNTLYEPHIGDKFFKEMVDAEDKIIRIHGYHIAKAIVKNGRVVGAVFANDDETDRITVKCKIAVDATELGDLLALAGCDYYVGQDPKSLTGEKGAPQEATDIIQDITYVAILKDYGTDSDKTIAKPEPYEPEQFDCTCSALCKNEKDKSHSCKKMLEYGKLPNNKYMINWPKKGNDYYLNAIEMSFKERRKAYQAAKNITLQWLFFIQTEGGYKNLGLADDEFNTSDLLAYKPYHRESRRLKGVVQLRNHDLVNMYKSPQGELYKYGISVGDYPLDLHHEKMPVKIEYSLEAVPSFSVPYTCLIPQKIDGLIVAEKSISVSHIVNGCTRLQPSVMGIGQAAGAAAAICVKSGIQPRKVNVRKLQQTLIDADCWAIPFLDVKPCSKYFKAVQRIGLSGVMQGEGIIINWANETWFYPENKVGKREFKNTLNICVGKESKALDIIEVKNTVKGVKRKYAIKKIWTTAIKNGFISAKSNSGLNSAIKYFKEKMLIDSDTKEIINGELTRQELAYWLDEIFNPFINLKLKEIKTDY